MRKRRGKPRAPHKAGRSSGRGTGGAARDVSSVSVPLVDAQHAPWGNARSDIGSTHGGSSSVPLTLRERRRRRRRGGRAAVRSRQLRYVRACREWPRGTQWAGGRRAPRRHARGYVGASVARGRRRLLAGSKSSWRTADRSCAPSPQAPPPAERLLRRPHPRRHRTRECFGATAPRGRGGPGAARRSRRPTAVTPDVWGSSRTRPGRVPRRSAGALGLGTSRTRGRPATGAQAHGGRA